MRCELNFWPLGPVFGREVALGVFAIVGVIFTIMMLIDCLKREPKDFPNPITHQGKSERPLWAVFIILSLWLYFIGAIAYYFVVKRNPSQPGQSQPQQPQGQQSPQSPQTPPAQQGEQSQP